MAIEVLSSNGDIRHEVKHDLESFFWLLIWCILRHTAHNAPCSKLFDRDDKDLAAGIKLQFLSTTKSLVVHKNVHLTKLLQTLTRFFLRQQDLVKFNQSSVEVTYEMLLDAIEDHLEMDGRPLDDAAIAFIDPSSSGVAQGTAHPSGSQQLPGYSNHRVTSKRKRRSATKHMPQDTSSSEEAVAAEAPVDRTSRWSGLRKHTKPVKRYRP